MKKIFSILVALVAMVNFQSCVVDETDDHYSATAKTLDATNVTSQGFTLNASIEYSGGTGCGAEGGLFYGSDENVSKDKCYGKISVVLKNGTNNISEHEDNVRQLLPIAGYTEFIFKPGKKVYYRAYATVIRLDKEDVCIYGDIKSFVVPEE